MLIESLVINATTMITNNQPDYGLWGFIATVVGVVITIIAFWFYLRDRRRKKPSVELRPYFYLRDFKATRFKNKITFTCKLVNEGKSSARNIALRYWSTNNTELKFILTEKKEHDPISIGNIQHDGDYYLNHPVKCDGINEARYVIWLDYDFENKHEETVLSLRIDPNQPDKPQQNWFPPEDVIEARKNAEKPPKGASF